MFLECVVVGDLFTNCYITGDEKGLVIIDPGAEPVKIFKVLKGIEKKSGSKVPAVVILTHAHPDHTGAVGDIAGELKCPIYMHDLDSEWLKEVFGSEFPGLHHIEDGEVLKIGGISLKVIHTPGHTEGSICLYDEKNGILFSGDTLFANGVGRTDMPGGSQRRLVTSLKRLMALPAGLRVCPGHGEETTIALEKAFLKSMGWI